MTSGVGTTILSFRFVFNQVLSLLVLRARLGGQAMFVPLFCWLSCPVGLAQTQDSVQLGADGVRESSGLPDGFQLIEGRYVDIITDLPTDDELRCLPQVFELAMPQWCEAFGVPLDAVNDWHAQAFIMLDRNRFERNGLIPEELPDFPYGFQYGDRMWVSEQPSAYYRRHLLLHEGTHWFMTRHFGSSGPPWLMEGMAEWLGTHRWDPATQQLEMGVIPRNRDEVPFWGRITRIQDQLNEASAPSLEAIMRYGATAHREVEAYAWSWAAVLFMLHHPDTKEAFEAMLRRPMRSDLSQTRWLFAELRSRWPKLRQAWNSLITDIDYGFDPENGSLVFSEASNPLGEATGQVDVDSDRSWQSSGLRVAAGQNLEIRAEGSVVLRQQSGAWLSYADGITLEYHRGQPLGRLMMAIAMPLEQEQPTQRLSVFPVGESAKLTVKAGGEVFFRINESSAELRDNSGQLTVTLRLLSEDR